MKKDLHDQCIRHIIIKYQDTKENGNILNPVGGGEPRSYAERLGLGMAPDLLTAVWEPGQWINSLRILREMILNLEFPTQNIEWT